MLVVHTEYQGFMPCGFRQEDFLKQASPIYANVYVHEHMCTPLLSNFGPMVII